jgi:hypothetical protein
MTRTGRIETAAETRRLEVRRRRARALRPVGIALAGIVLSADVGAGGATAAAAEPVAASAVPPPTVGRSGVAIADAGQEGVWVPREYTFTYMGLTAYYSCESLANKLRILLDLAGARDDAKVSPRGCIDGPNRIQPIPSAQLKFHVFVPADEAPAPAKAPEKPAPPARQLGRDAPKLKRVGVEPEPGVGAWRRVELDGRRPRRLEAGDCEVIEQFARQVLPMFHTRNLKDDVRCTPGRVSASDVRLSFESLGPLPKADVAKAPPKAVPKAEPKAESKPE